MRYKKFFLIVFSLLIVLVYVASVYAADIGINENIKFIENFTSSVGDTLIRYARSLFIGLATISLAIGLGRMLLSGESNIGSVASHLAKWIIYVGVFLWIMSDSGLANFLPKLVVNSFMEAGKSIAVQAGEDVASTEIAPDNLLSHGVHICGDIITKAWTIGWQKSIIISLVTVIFFIFIALIVAHLTIALIEMHIVICGGAILIGFGGFEYTRDIALSYFKYSISIGIKILVIMIVYILANKMLREYETTFKAAEVNDLLSLALQMLSGGICIYLTIKMIPSMAQSIVNGAASSFGHELFTTPAAAFTQNTVNLIKKILEQSPKTEKRSSGSGGGSSERNGGNNANSTTFRGGASRTNIGQQGGQGGNAGTPSGTSGQSMPYRLPDSRSANRIRHLTGYVPPALPDFKGRNPNNDPPNTSNDKPDSPKRPDDPKA